MGTDVTEFVGSLEVGDDGEWKLILQLPSVFARIRASGRRGTVEAWVGSERVTGTVNVKRPDRERG